MSKSTFVLVASDNLTHGICNLHVDDRLLVGNTKSKDFLKTFQEIKKLFAVKEWINLSENKLGEILTDP